jgi:hypothetical protein
MFPGPPEHAAAMMAFYRNELKKVFGNDVAMHFGQQAPGVNGLDVLNENPEYWKWRQIRDTFDPSGQMLSAAQKKLLLPIPH